MTYSYLNIQKQKNKQILNYIKHEKSTITSKRDTHSSYWTGDFSVYILNMCIRKNEDRFAGAKTQNWAI